ncbi:Hypothetical predicted protein [Cloeon dipterum]|uniref:Glycoprotein-N-acetylgalactosamine 3-beta-galactosyltransferase 1 n=2 Tax=Cloeon dipterum TaxID=197152 RepID=A0A8S1BTL1_9INSE|nr:Hypothetical predicted protein [Cloeon dipterum]
MGFCKFNRRRTKSSSSEVDPSFQLTILFLTGLFCGFSYSAYFYSAYMSPLGNASKVQKAPNESLSRLVHKALDLNGSIIEQLFYEMQTQRNQKLFEEVRILCWVCTSANTANRSVHVKATWGRRCNKIIFISEEEDDFLPTIKVDARPGREGLWAKTVHAFNYIFDNYINDYDWFLKADDDSYVLVDNLRKLLLPYDPNDPDYFGFHFKTIVPRGYMSGGAGYALSREAVKRLVTRAFAGEITKCPNQTADGSEDADLGRCLDYAEVYPGDSRDEKGHFRFYPFVAENYVHPDLSEREWWYWYFIKWPHKGGADCCSKHPITFHYMTPHHLYMMEHLVYNQVMFSVTDVMAAENPGPDNIEQAEQVAKKITVGSTTTTPSATSLTEALVQSTKQPKS